VGVRLLVSFVFEFWEFLDLVLYDFGTWRGLPGLGEIALGVDIFFEKEWKG
jgi:hypothetical protein